jgi:CheY-like chemotaxis protein
MLFDTVIQAFGESVSETARVAQRHEQEAEVLEHIRGANVLLVEDNEINQQVAQEILEGAGLNVSLANDGQEAIDAIQGNEYDAVLMDVQMPVMDGYTATGKLRQDQRFKELPIIAMTAHAMAGDADKSLAAGMSDHVTKPIDPDQLFATLQKWIQPGKKEVRTPQPEGPAEADVIAETAPQTEGRPKSLPEFDLQDGLKRLQGNEKLYRKLLLDFGAKYGGTANEIRQALDAKDFDQAHSLVHNLKGLAGNLAATHLQAAAVEMEKRVKGGQKKGSSTKELDQKFAELKQAIEKALSAVQTLGPSVPVKPAKAFSEVLEEIPAELARKAAGQIREAAEMGDVTLIRSIAEKLKSRSEAFAPFADRFIQMAEDFDFDNILKLADQLDPSQKPI